MAQPKKPLLCLNARAIFQCKIEAIMVNFKTFLSNSFRAINLNLATVSHKKLLLLVATDASLTTEMLRHACRHVTLTGGTTLIDTHTLATLLIDIRASQTTLNHPGCWPDRAPPAFLFSRPTLVCGQRNRSVDHSAQCLPCSDPSYVFPAASTGAPGTDPSRNAAINKNRNM